jgi:hypothetical protein
MVDPISLAVSVLALAVSAATAWLTLFRRGTVRMTQPTVIYFGPDAKGSRGETISPKVFLRTLLFSTSKRGRIIESLYVTLSRSEVQQTFSVWVYGDDKLVRGSGLFVGETGVEANHHFLAPTDASQFRFIAGQYKIEVFARLLGNSARMSLFTQTLEVTPEIARMLTKPETGLYFDWAPDAERYVPHIDKRAPPK